MRAATGWRWRLAELDGLAGRTRPQCTCMAWPSAPSPEQLARRLQRAKGAAPLLRVIRSHQHLQGQCPRDAPRQPEPYGRGSHTDEVTHAP